MKKLLLILIIIIALIIAGVHFFLDAAIKNAVEKYVPPVTGTSVEVKSVSTSLLKGRATVKGLLIGNPKGFKTPHIFKLGEITLQVDIKSLFSNQIIVDEVTIKGAVAALEVTQNGTNVGALLNTLNKGSTAQKTTTTAKKTESKSTKTVLIRELTFAGSQIEVTLAGNNAVVPLPNIYMKNVGKDKKSDLTEVIRQVLAQFSTEAIQTFTKEQANILKGKFNEIKDNVKANVDNAKKTVEDAKQNASQAVKDTKAAVKDVKTDVKGTVKDTKDAVKDTKSQLKGLLGK